MIEQKIQFFNTLVLDMLTIRMTTTGPRAWLVVRAGQGYTVIEAQY